MNYIFNVFVKKLMDVNKKKKSASCQCHILTSSLTTKIKIVLCPCATGGNVLSGVSTKEDITVPDTSLTGAVSHLDHTGNSVIQILCCYKQVRTDNAILLQITSN